MIESHNLLPLKSVCIESQDDEYLGLDTVPSSQYIYLKKKAETIQADYNSVSNNQGLDEYELAMAS